MGVWTACWIGVASAGEFGGDVTAWGAWSDPRQQAAAAHAGGPGFSAEIGFWQSPEGGLIDVLQLTPSSDDEDDEPARRTDASQTATALRYSQSAFGDWDGPHLHHIQLAATQAVPFVRRGGLGFAPEVTTLSGASWVSGDLGSSTTELGDPNRAHYGWGMELGARLYLPGPVSLSYRYSLVSVEEPWRFGHQLVHGLMVGLSVAAVQAPLYFMFDETDQKAARLAAMLLGAAVNAGWYALDYNRHNWPFDDEAPMRMNAHMVGVSVRY